MIDSQTNKPRQPGTTLSLSNTLRSLDADLGCKWHCSGNDAFGALLAFQLLMDPEGTQLPTPKLNGHSTNRSPGSSVQICTNLGTGPVKPVLLNPNTALLAPPPPISGYFEDFEAFAQRHGQRRSSGRGTKQKENNAKSGEGSTLRNGTTVLDVMTKGTPTAGRASRRHSSGVSEALSQSMNRLGTR